jgi:hypothetical protein
MNGAPAFSDVLIAAGLAAAFGSNALHPTGFARLIIATSKVFSQ